MTRKPVYVYTVVYTILMAVLPFIGIPFSFRRFLVLALSLIFLGYIWYRRHQATHARVVESPVSVLNDEHKEQTIA